MNEIAESIWEIRGSAHGKTVVILGGIHGNERTGIEVVQRLRDLFISEKNRIASGTLILALGNLEAIKLNRRFTKDGKDLNRLFSDKHFSQAPDGTPEDARSRLLAPFLAQADILLDLHATNKPSVPFFVCADTERHLDVCRYFSAGRLLADPNHVLGGEPVTTDEYVDLCGGVGVCYETGFAADTSRAHEVVEEVLMLLRGVGIVQDDIPPKSRPRSKEIFVLAGRIDLDARGFRFADQKGSESFEEIKKGEIIGFAGREPIVSEEDGVLVFPKIPEHWKIGSPVVYLAKHA